MALAEWIQETARLAAEHVDRVGDAGSIEQPMQKVLALLEADRITLHSMVDMVLQYDRDGVLGGQGWIGANMSAEQVLVLVRRLARQASKAEQQDRGRIEVTFYTPSDDFHSETTADEAREWLRSRGKVLTWVRRPDGSHGPGRHLDELDGSTLARWYAAVSLSEVKEKSEAGRSVNILTTTEGWVSIRAERIEAIGAEYHEIDNDEDDEPGDGSPTPELGSPFDDLDWNVPVH